jgi:hypothetical protein
MSRWRAFVEVLDELLTDQAPADTLPAGRIGASLGLGGTPLYGFAPQPLANRFWADPATARSGRLADPGAPLSEPRANDRPHKRADDDRSSQVPTPVRDLTPSEDAALRTLVRLGAGLDRHFTSRQLRSTFRTLAQRYHPDRHPQATPAERTQLGAAFAELTQAYGLLHNVCRDVRHPVVLHDVVHSAPH